MLTTLAAEVSPVDPKLVAGAGAGLAFVWFLFNNRERLKSIVMSLVGLLGDWKKQSAPVVPAEKGGEFVEVKDSPNPSLGRDLEILGALNRAELEILASGNFSALAQIETARGSLSVHQLAIQDQNLVINMLASCSKFFRDKGDDAGRDAITAAYKRVVGQ